MAKIDCGFLLKLCLRLDGAPRFCFLSRRLIMSREREQMEKKVIESYQNDEKMMILVYAQWCINNDIDPQSLYMEAYPEQTTNKILLEVLELTVPQNESEHIPNETVLNMLQLYGNDDLAFIVQREIDRLKSKWQKE